MNKLAIVCGAPSSEMSAPFNDPDYEIWVLANRLGRYPRADLAFEIHDSLAHYPESYADHVLSFGVPLIVGENTKIAGENVSIYPFERVFSEFGRKYLTSSCAYMMALAIAEGYERIEVYGVDLAVDDNEYFYQRPCMEYWIGVADGRGIEVVLPDACPVAKSAHLYGVQPHKILGVYSEAELLKVAKMHRDAVDKDQEQIRALESRITAHDAAAQVYERLAKVSRGIEAGQDFHSLTDTVAIR